MTEHPVRVLLDDADPLRRCQAHIELSRRAMARQDLDSAADHLREAADLDPTDERPRALLRELGSTGTRKRRFSWPWRK